LQTVTELCEAEQISAFGIERPGILESDLPRSTSDSPTYQITQESELKNTQTVFRRCGEPGSRAGR
jgi:hypothetical protein